MGHSVQISVNSEDKPKKLYLKICEHCNQSYHTNHKRAKTCGDTCRYALRSNTHSINRICKTCAIEYTTTAHNAGDYCSTHCRNIARSSERYTGIEGVDYIVCPVCNIRTRQINPSHAVMHGFESIKHMQQQLSMPLVTCIAKKEKSAGANNPGYQHGGKYSHFSKKFVKGYNKDKHNKTIETVRANNVNNPELFKTSIAYWLNVADGDEALANMLYKKFQTRDLAWFIDKFGEIEGPLRHKAKTDKWISSMQSKTLDELLDINKRKVTKSRCFYSKAEKEIFATLKSIFSDLNDQIAICRNPCDQKKKFYLYDMALGNKIIEYNGDFWHANPTIYDNTFICSYNKTYDEIHTKDADKLQTAVNNGYRVLVIWESDYKSNPTKVIEECIQFLKQ